jgi:hypothetical protein
VGWFFRALVLSSDETAYAYVYDRVLSEAYLVTGLRQELLANIPGVGRVSAEKCRSAEERRLNVRRSMKLDLRCSVRLRGNSGGS